MAPASSNPSFQIRPAQVARSRSTLREVQMPTLPSRSQAEVVSLPSAPPPSPASGLSFMDRVAPRLSRPRLSAQGAEPTPPDAVGEDPALGASAAAVGAAAKQAADWLATEGSGGLGAGTIGPDRSGRGSGSGPDRAPTGTVIPAGQTVQPVRPEDNLTIDDSSDPDSNASSPSGPAQPGPANSGPAAPSASSSVTSSPVPPAMPNPQPASSSASVAAAPYPHRDRTGAAPSYATITVQPFTVTTESLKEPSLPKVKTPGFTQHRHSSNPCFAMSLLQDIATVVSQWQLELEEVHHQIQAIYMEGPIVDGWLEADTGADGSVRGYRLCGLDQNGQLWSRPCPPDQLPGLSVAIARYQTLRQTMAQKHRLEVRLKQLGETLAVLRSRL